MPSHDILRGSITGGHFVIHDYVHLPSERQEWTKSAGAAFPVGGSQGIQQLEFAKSQLDVHVEN